MRRGLIVLALAAACGGGKQKTSEAPAPGGETAAAAPDRAMLAEIAAGLADVLATMAVISERAADCPTMAAQLDELFDKSAPLFDLARTQSADPEAGPLLTAEMDAREREVAPLVERIATGLDRCRTDPEVARAIERMPTF